MTERKPLEEGRLCERRIYVGPKGHRYVKPEELYRDPEVIERLKSAKRLAIRLGLKEAKNEG